MGDEDKSNSNRTRASKSDKSEMSIADELRKLSEKMDGTRSSLEKTIKDKIKEVKSEIKELDASLVSKMNDKIGQLKDSLVELVNANQTEMKAELKKRFEEVYTNIDTEVGHLNARINQVEANFQEKIRRVEFDPEVSLIVSGLQFEEGENLMMKIKRLLTEGLQCDPVPTIVAVERMLPKGRGPGVVKVEMESTQDKVAVLRLKRELKDNETYDNVYVRSAKSHTERLAELNFRALLGAIPAGNNFFIAANGRVVKRDPNHQGSALASETHSGRSRSPPGAALGRDASSRARGHGRRGRY